MVLAKRAKNPPTLAQPQRAYDAATLTAEAPSVLRTELGQALGRGWAVAIPRTNASVRRGRRPIVSLLPATRNSGHLRYTYSPEGC
jgi:hypothetical protein